MVVVAIIMEQRIMEEVTMVAMEEADEVATMVEVATRLLAKH